MNSTSITIVSSVPSNKYIKIGEIENDTEITKNKIEFDKAPHIKYNTINVALTHFNSSGKFALYAHPTKSKLIAVRQRPAFVNTEDEKSQAIADFFEKRN